MNNGQRTVAGMLAAVVVVLGLLAFAPKPPEPPRIIGITAAISRTNETRSVWRLWSDGLIEENRRTSSDIEWSGWEVVHRPGYVQAASKA